MPDNSPCCRPGYVSTESMRAYMLDRSVEDNTIELDLYWSDEEIRTGMQACARDYNGLPPRGVSSVFADQLPAFDNTFFYGVAKQLYLSALQKLMRNDIDYDGGGVQVNIVKARIEHFKFLIKLMDGEFKESATSHKKNINYLSAYGVVG